MGNQVEASLLCPVIVDDCPIHLSPNHSSTHSIYVPENDWHIKLQHDRIVLYIDTFCPSDDNLEHGTWVEMTSSTVKWSCYLGTDNMILVKQRVLSTALSIEYRIIEYQTVSTTLWIPDSGTG